MSSPFPGMDPYIENPNVWPNFHTFFMVHIAQLLNARLPSHYVAETEPRVEIGYLDSEDTRIIRPDVGVIERPDVPELVTSTGVEFNPFTVKIQTPAVYRPRIVSIQIKAYPEDQVVTIIELLSPINKRPGNKAYEEYFSKRMDILESRVHLLELDFLRKGRRVIVPEELPAAPYYALLNRSKQRQFTEVWAIQLEEPLPLLPVPLLPGDPDIPLALDKAMSETYEGAQLNRRIDYTQPPLGPLNDEQRAYIDELLAPLRETES